MPALTVDARETLYVARQPILEPSGAVFGYELLYRDAAERDTHERADAAGARVLTDAVLNLGLATITGGKPAFINLTRPLLLRLPSLVPPGTAVFELQADIPVSDEVFEACRALHEAGYSLGLDDFCLDSDAAALLPFVKFVKVDAQRSPSDCGAIAHSLAASRITLIATNVMTQETFAATKAAGFHLFQGHYFSQPTLCGGGALPGRHLAYLQLLAALNKPDLTVSEIEDLVKHDVSLSYRILRCVNSAAFAMKREVHSIRQALLLLGLAPIRSWASVWCVAGLNTGGVSELVTTVLIRGRCCELLADRLGDGTDSSEMFLVGLCSMLDSMLGRPMSVAVEELPLSADAKGALLGEHNTQGILLDAVTAYEQGEWDAAISSVQALGVGGADLAAAYTDSLRWARELSQGA
jgi:c-di-GMP-related signal transduction protein